MVFRVSGAQDYLNVMGGGGTEPVLTRSLLFYIDNNISFPTMKSTMKKRRV